MTTVSVVVRCAGRERLFDGVLDRLRSQTIPPSEILVVMDCDREAEIEEANRRLKGYPNAKLLAFEHARFSHPYSANLGVAASKGELVCITNGHALPISLRWLEAGVQHFNDARVAGVGGFFLPYARGVVNHLFYMVEATMERITWISTINCIISKARWAEYPFDEDLPTIIPEMRKYGGEDYDWTLEMIARGYRIILDPKFSVIHAHEENSALETWRNLKNYFIYKKLRERIKRLRRPRRSFRFTGST